MDSISNSLHGLVELQKQRIQLEMQWREDDKKIEKERDEKRAKERKEDLDSLLKFI